MIAHLEIKNVSFFRSLGISLTLANILTQASPSFVQSSVLFIICSSTTYVFQNLPDSIKYLDGLDEVAGFEPWRHHGGRTKRIEEALSSRHCTARGEENITTVNCYVPIAKATAGSQPARLCI